MVRTAKASWEGNLKDGHGKISVESELFKDAAYSFSRRFENEKGTNPEELLAAAHAGCFSMALSAGISGAGFNVLSIVTQDNVILDKVEGGFAISKIEINTEADIVGIDEATFNKIAEDTKKNCPVSKALKGVEFILNAKLKSAAAKV